MELRGVEGYRRVYYYEYNAAKNGAVGERPIEGDPIAAGTIILAGHIEIREPFVGDAALTLSLMRPGDIWQSGPGFLSSLSGAGSVVPCPLPPPGFIRCLVQGARPILGVAGEPLTRGVFVLALEGVG